MPLNKFAPWGTLPPPRPARPGIAAVVATLVKDQAPVPPPQQPPTPSRAALWLIWTLNAVRDALSDQGDPSPTSTNEQLAVHERSASVAKAKYFLERRHAGLVRDYTRQFRPVDDESEMFDLDRRQRLAELLRFEWAVMTNVVDMEAAAEEVGLVVRLDEAAQEATAAARKAEELESSFRDFLADFRDWRTTIEAEVARQGWVEERLVAHASTGAEKMQQAIAKVEQRLDSIRAEAFSKIDAIEPRLAGLERVAAPEDGAKRRKA